MVLLNVDYHNCIYFLDLGTQTDSSNLPISSLDYVKAQATKITNGVQNIISKEIESIKSKIRTASSVTDTIQNYFTNRKRSLWLWVEDRSLLNRLGYIFRSNLRKTYSCGDLKSTQQEEHRKGTVRGKYDRHELDDAFVGQMNDGIHRYYHVFQKGELTRLIQDNEMGLKIYKEWFEQGNWVIIAKKI